MPTGTWTYITTDNTSGIPVHIDGSFTYTPNPITWTTTTSSSLIYSNPLNNSKESEKKKMSRGLYQVYIVDPETDEVVHETGPIVARDEDSAQLKAVQIAGVTLMKDIDDYDFIVVELGEVRVKKEVQEVRIAEKK